jgi:predicted nucleic acid-binding protein
LQQFLDRHRKIGLDTSVFIFQVEENPKYLDLVKPIFAWLDGPRTRAVTSTITMLELLVQPYRLSDIDRVNQFYALLSTYPHLDWIAPTLEIADRAAMLRAEFRLRTPDALQAATALASQATGFVSNDPVFLKVPGLEAVILDDLSPK